MLFGFRPALAEDPAQVHAAAARGTATPAMELPYADRIQRAFGRHDISGIKAHVGGDAAASARTMGAEAYATGDHVVLGGGTDLHTVAHEAAHVVQQRGGVQLKTGVGEVGDQYEHQADAVADRVVRGESAETLLDVYAGERSSPATPATEGVQRRQIVPDASLRARVISLPALIDTTAYTAKQLEDLLTILEAAREDSSILPGTLPERKRFQELIGEVTMELVDAIATEDYKQDGAATHHSPASAMGLSEDVPAPPPVSHKIGLTTAPPAKPPSDIGTSGGPISFATPPSRSLGAQSKPATEDDHEKDDEKEKPKSKEKGESSSLVKNPNKGKVKKLRGNFGTAVHDQMHFAPTDTKPHHGVWSIKLAQVKEKVGLALDSIHGGDGYVVASKSGGKNWRFLVNMGEVVGYLSGSAVTGKPQATHIEVILDKKGNTVSAFPSSPDIF